MKRYIIEFRSVSNTLYTIKLFDHLNRVAGDYTYTDTYLAASDDPFHLDWDNSEDPFMPRRKCTGTVSFVTDDVDILKKIVPNGYTDFPVIAYRNNSPFFYGFLSPETFETEYSNRHREITLNIVDCLTAMDYIQLRNYSDSLTVVKIADVIRGMVNDLWTHFTTYGGETNRFRYYIPTEFFNFIASTANISVCHLKTYQESADGNATGYIMKTMGEVVDMVCELTGCQTVQDGEYFLTGTFPFSCKLYCLTNNDSVLMQAPELYSSIVYRGTDHSISRFAGAKSVSVVSEFETQEPQLNLPSFPLLEDSMYIKATKERGTTGDWTHYASIKAVPDEQLPGDILCFRYRLDMMKEGDNVYWYKTKYITIDELLNNNLFTGQDVTGQIPEKGLGGGANMYYTGGVLSELIFGSRDKLSDPMITMRGLFVANCAYYTMPCAHIESRRKFHLQKGAYVRLSYDAKAFTMSDIPSPYKNHVVQHDAFAIYAFVIKIGDKYVDGDNLTSSTEKTRLLKNDVDGNPECNLSDEYLKRLGFSGKGLYIVIPEECDADIQIDICTSPEDYYHYGTHSLAHKFYFFKGLKVEYLGLPNSDSFYNKRSVEYKEIINVNFSDEVEVSPKLVSKITANASYADNTVKSSDGTEAMYGGFIPCNDNQTPLTVTILPEKNTLEKLKAFYRACRYKIELETDIRYNNLLRRYITTSESDRAVLVAKSDDYLLEQQKQTFLDVQERKVESGIAVPPAVDYTRPGDQPWFGDIYENEGIQ